MTHRSAFIVTLIVLVALAPTGADAQRSRAACSVDSIDVVHTQRGPVWRDCDVDTRASLRREPLLEFAFPQDVTCVMAELEFVVDTTGVPDTAATVVVVESNDPTFVTFLRQRLGEFRYKPARKDGMSVRQVVRVRKVMQAKLAFTVRSASPSTSIGAPSGPQPPVGRRPQMSNCR